MALITVDDPTVQAILQAFNECQADCKAAESAVITARDNLRVNWKSDAAAPKYLSTVDMWLDGFHRVQAGLVTLDGAMQDFRQLTTSVEQSNTAPAGGWAGAH